MQTARLKLSPQTEKKMNHLVGDLGVDVIDEISAVPADLLHADALRRTYGRCLRHNLDTTCCMIPSETWGRMPAKILAGDFHSLPPVPQEAMLLSPVVNKSYEHQQGAKLLSNIEYVVEFTQMQRVQDPLLAEVLAAMRTPGGKQISDEAWRAITATLFKMDSKSGASQPADSRVRDARGWYHCAHEWRLVSYAMHAHARLNAKAAGKVLYYIPCVDLPAIPLTKDDFDKMREEPNISTTAQLPGMLALYVGAQMILTESYLPGYIAGGAPVVVEDIEPHPNEPEIRGRASIASHGCVLLQYMPKCIYVRLQKCTTAFLTPQAGATQPGAAHLLGVFAVQPVSRSWLYKRDGDDLSIRVSRTQVPLLAQKQCTLHGVHGKTAEPGLIAHWTFPSGLSRKSIWLAYYQILSRPTALQQLLSFGLPRRDIIEGGPPEDITEAFEKFFTQKIVQTKAACAKARQEMKWPPRRR